MRNSSTLKALLFGTVMALPLTTVASAENLNIPAGDLETALNAYAAQTGVPLALSATSASRVQTKGVRGNLSAVEALSRLLAGTGFVARRDSGLVTIVRDRSSQNTGADVLPLQLAQAASTRPAVETVTVTSSKLGGADVQSIPIAITALSQEQLTATQTAGGPDLIKSVPNMTFTKTNFTGYSIQIRGIGTQAISVTTDPAVAVALNDIPFIRNHFFEQEFYDIGQAEVLRGPQGTLYGRNATAGVVNLVTAKPTDQFEAMASGDIGNYHNRRFEGMVNLPIVDDRVDIRLAGEWTKRQGYTTNLLTGDSVDGRDLWSSRLSIGWKPLLNLKATIVWEHFSEDDDRMRTAKQLCKTDPGASNILGTHVPNPGETTQDATVNAFMITTGYLSQGCLPASLYSPESFEVPNGYALPYVVAGWVSSGVRVSNPYTSATQSSDLRAIETQINPEYRAKNDTVELNVDYGVTPALTLTSQTGFNQDVLWSTEDYNRFNTAPGIFQPLNINGTPYYASIVSPDGVFCDPQLGCSDRLVAQDISREHAWQLSQEFRLASNFSGPLNFSAGGNYMHYETVEDYYVFANTLTMFAAYAAGGSGGFGGSLNNYRYGQQLWMPGVSDNHQCLVGNSGGYQYSDPALGAGVPTQVCYSLDPASLANVDDQGHNYFLSRNPYTLNSYAGFGEVHYNVLNDLKLTGGLRWTDDQKHFTLIPSELIVAGYGYPSIGVVDQDWQKFTGRFAVNWTPKLSFTDQTLVYGSYARGYKAGGANPPGAVLYAYGNSGVAGVNGVPVHPLTFAPEFVNAFEVGSKNTLLDGALTLNGTVFFYDYKGYQISEIVDRTSINLNFDATVKGAELEATYEPMPGLKFHFAGGYEKTRLADGSNSVDLMDRTAGHPGWILFKPFVTQPSNCILPDYVVADLILKYNANGIGNPAVSACGGYPTNVDPVVQGVYHDAWSGANDPSLNLVSGQPYYSQTDPVGNVTYHGYPLVVTGSGNSFVYSGYNPATAPNGGAGFSKDLSGNELPNAPPFTISMSADYTIPVTADWASTFHVDYYWQDYSWARVFNDNPYDRLRGYTTVNLALILTSQDGWQVMGYLKNVFNVTDITGTFLNSDDSGLTTNVFLTDPRLFGVRVTKNW